jgi:hypothetical protein
MTEPWPPEPVEISGKVVARILGLKLATVTLDLRIVARDRFSRWIEPESRHYVATSALPVRSHRASTQLGNGERSIGQGDLQEILQLLDKTSRLLE